MATITIGSFTFDAYADVEEANEYLEADFDADEWRASEEIDQQRALVTASRLIDRLRWPGEKEDADQIPAFPRTGISGFEDGEIPLVVVHATILLAKFIRSGAKLETQPGVDSTNVKRIKAGSVEQEFFRPSSDGGRLPLSVMELLRGLLGSTSRIGSALSYGTDACTVTERDFGRAQGI